MIGKSSFIVENIPAHLEVKEKLAGNVVVSCKICSIEITLNKMRTHVGKHILWSMRGIKVDGSIEKPVRQSFSSVCNVKLTTLVMIR